MKTVRILSASVALVVIATAAVTASAQEITETAFPTVDALIKDGLKSVSSMRELPDGRVLVVDSAGQKLVVANWATGKLETRMTGGTDDREFRALGPLWHWSGDSLAVADLPKGQLLILGPDGAVVRNLRFGRGAGSVAMGRGDQARTAGGGGGGGEVGGRGSGGRGGGATGGATGGAARGAAGRGAQVPSVRYLIGTTVVLGSGAPARPATPSTSLQPPRTLFPITRLSLQTATIDTVAQLMSAQAPRAPQMSTTVGTFSIYVGTSPVQLLDAWAAFDDGTVAVVRSVPYRVDLFGPDGSRTQLEPIPAPAIPLTSGDRKRVVEEYRQATADVVKSDPRRTSILAVAYEEPLAWPPTHPPFRGDVAPLVDDGDRIWVQTRCLSDEQAVCYDVISRSGVRAARYKLPPKTTVAGFGKNTVFTVFEQKSDKVQLQRHVMN